MSQSEHTFSTRFYSSTRFFSVALLGLLLSAAAALPAPAQQVRVQNGATVEVSNGGVWDLQGGTMDFGPSGATATLSEEGGGRVSGGQLAATRSLSNPSSADPAGLGVEISASVALGDVTVTRGHAVQTGSGNESIRRYYVVSPSKNNSGLSATLTHTYHDAELNSLSEGALELFKSTDGGTTWTQEGADSRSTGPTGGNTVTLSGIESFSRWTLGSSSSPLPVELASFEATNAEAGGTGEEAVRLSWTTASEQNNAGFEIQRKGAERSGGWQKVGFRASKAPGGTTTEAQTYRFGDEDLPYQADTLSYRLRQVDVDGRATLTDPVAVARGTVERLQLKKTFPNPARQRVTVRYAVPQQEGTEVTLHLYDVLGRQVRSVRAPDDPGRHERTLSLGTLGSGVYFLRLRDGGTIRTQRLTVVR